MDSTVARAAGFLNGATELSKDPRPTKPIPDVKLAALAATGTLNHNPAAVVDPPFRSGGFFDPRDLLQLRYEMVRRHRVDAVPVAVTARLFGVSLPTAYQAHAAFEVAGLGGLLPKRRGPKQGHKLTPEILAYIERRRHERPDWRAGDLLTELQSSFGLTIHRRSVERVLRGKKSAAAMNDVCCRQDAADYEALRNQALQAGFAQASALLPCGLAVWLIGPSSGGRPPRRQPPNRLSSTEMYSCGPLPAVVASIVQRLARQEAAHA
jgi:transposase